MARWSVPFFKSRKSRWLVGLTLVVLVIASPIGRRWVSMVPNGQARRALGQRDLAAASVWLERSAWIHADNSETEFLLARVARKQGRLEDFREHLMRAWNLGAETERLEREQWLALAQSGDMQEAEPHLGLLLQDPREDGAEICEAYALGYITNLRPNEAVRILRAWAAEYPDDPQAPYLRGTLHADMTQWNEAVEAFRQALDCDPKHALTNFSLGQIHLLQNRPDEALKCFGVAIAGTAQEQRSEALVGKARALESLGRKAEARTCLEAAFEAAPGSIDATIALGRLELSVGNFQEAVEHLKTADAAIPHDPDLRFSLAMALQGLRQLDEAQEHFRFVQAARKELSRARSLMDVVLKTPDDVSARYEIGKIYLNYGSEQDALTWLKSALNYDPSHSPTHALLAEYYSQRTAENPDFESRAAEHRKQIRLETP
ncbi:MAG: tetratricopeptide repeat protein [Planctomycetota bacterium]|nr:tetratricopeptide repeat protein [Planctomycetota bacterium]